MPLNGANVEHSWAISKALFVFSLEALPVLFCKACAWNFKHGELWQVSVRDGLFRDCESEFKDQCAVGRDHGQGEKARMTRLQVEKVQSQVPCLASSRTIRTHPKGKFISILAHFHSSL